MDKSLKTQKQGRLYAIAVLDRLQKAGGNDDHIACPFNPYAEAGDTCRVPGYWRTGPQWSGFADDVFHLFRNGSEEAQKGFLSIFTDCFAGNVNQDLGFYRRWERKGWLQDLGKNGSEMPLPEVKGSWTKIEHISGWKPLGV